MKTNTTIFTAIMVTLGLMVSFNAGAEESITIDPAATYGQLLDQYIAKCDAKLEMKDSGLNNIRRAAATAMLKGAFAKTYRTELIDGMIQEGVEPKAYKVQLFLNDRFYRLVRTKSTTL
jgi:hypothetical protein